MIRASAYRVTANALDGRRACAKPDLPPGRAFRNNCRAWGVCDFWQIGSAKLDRLPRLGLAHAAFGGAAAHA